MDILEFANNTNSLIYLWFNFVNMFFEIEFLNKLHSQMFLGIYLSNCYVIKG